MVIYESLIEAAEVLSFEQQAGLYLAVVRYVEHGEEPQLDLLQNLVFLSHKKALQNQYKKMHKTPDEKGCTPYLKKGVNPISEKGSSPVLKKGGTTQYSTVQCNTVQSSVCASAPAPTRHTQRSKPFKPPTTEQVTEYAESRGGSIDAERFCDFYASKGWMVGKNKMKDWKAAVRNWLKNDRQRVRSDSGSLDFSEFDSLGSSDVGGAL